MKKVFYDVTHSGDSFKTLYSEKKHIMLVKKVPNGYRWVVVKGMSFDDYFDTKREFRNGFVGETTDFDTVASEFKKLVKSANTLRFAEMVDEDLSGEATFKYKGWSMWRHRSLFKWFENLVGNA